jgi:hypothetical protein
MSILAAVAAACVAGCASAQGSAQRVEFQGCPVAGVEHGCMVVKSGAATYNISSARPPVEIKGLAIKGSGVKSGGMSYCQQGEILTDIKYEYTKTPCPAPK